MVAQAPACVVAQVFNLCGHRPEDGASSSSGHRRGAGANGLYTEFGREAGVFLFKDQRIMLRLVQGFDFDISVQIRPMQLGGR